MDTTDVLFFAMLRISAVQILRAAGLTTAKPSVVDAVVGILPLLYAAVCISTYMLYIRRPIAPYPVPCRPLTHFPVLDIFVRYLHLLGTTTRSFAEVAGRTAAELPDVRAALEHVGAIWPLDVYSDPEDDDTHAIEALVEWFRGNQAAEIRRVAGMKDEDRRGEEWNSLVEKVKDNCGT